jgi:hypothetical protein
MDKKKIVQSASYLLCAAVAFAVPSSLVESEFSGGLVTGALLRMHNLGTWLFVLAALVALLYRRVAAVEALVAVLFCAPLCFYLIAPGLFQSVLPGDYSIGAPSGLSLPGWAVLSIASFAAAIYVSVRAFYRLPESRPL